MDTYKDELLKRYQNLDDDAKILMRLKAFLLIPISKTKFMEHLKLVWPVGKKKPTAKAVNEIIDWLVGEELLDENQLTCAPEIAHELTIEALANDDRELYHKIAKNPLNEQHVPQIYYQSSSPNLSTLCQLRLSVYQNDEGSFQDHFSDYNNHYKNHKKHYRRDPQWPPALIAVFGDSMPDLDWILTRKESIRLPLIEARLKYFIDSGAHIPEETKKITQYFQGQNFKLLPDGLQQNLVLFDILNALFPSALERLRIMAGKPGDVNLEQCQCLSALLSFLQGDCTQAVQLFSEALKTRRRIQKKRKICLAEPFSFFHVLALIGTNDPARHQEISTTLDLIIQEGTRHPVGWSALKSLFSEISANNILNAQKEEKRFFLSDMDEDFSGLSIVLATIFAEFKVSGGGKKNLSDELLQPPEPDHPSPIPIYHLLTIDLFAPDSQFTGELQQTLKETAGTSLLSLRSLILHKPQWERSLDALEQALGIPGATKAGDSALGGPSKRLAWIIDFDRNDISVLEQSHRKDGSWSEGRPVALKRLHKQDQRLTYLIEPDRKAAATIKIDRYGWYNRDEHYYFDLKRTVPALIGHPNVYAAQAPQTRIELVPHTPELVVHEGKDRLTLRLSHFPDEETQVFFEQETPTRWRVITFPKKLMPLARLLGEDGLSVPPDGRDRVLTLCRREHPGLPIRAEVEDDALPSEPGDPTPVMRLLPLEQGLRATLLVQPFGSEGGPYHLPGHKPAVVAAMLEGRSRRAQRDLAAEKKAAKALITACPILDQHGGKRAEWEFTDLEESLMLLSELSAYDGPMRMEWPEGQALSVLPHSLATDQVSFRIKQKQDWFSVNGDIAIDEDLVLDLQTVLDRMDDSVGRFLPLDDGRFIALTERLQRQLERLRTLSTADKDGPKLPTLGVLALDELFDEAGKVKGDKGWANLRQRLEAARAHVPVVPTTLQAELRDYQREGFAWLSQLAQLGAGACLADDMGLGKTVQTLALILERAQQGPTLVVAPTSVCHNWMNEIATFAPTLEAELLSRASDRAALVGEMAENKVLICSYGLLHQESDLLAGREWTTLVLDETQAIKNPDTKRAQAAWRLSAGFRVALTGTPVENHLDELWSLFRFLNPGLLGSRPQFQKRLAAAEAGEDQTHQFRQGLRAVIRPFILRRTKSAVLNELPPRTEQILRIEMSREERAFYEALRRHALESITALDDDNQGRRRLHILAEITRLRRACCHPSLVDERSAEAAALALAGNGKKEEKGEEDAEMAGSGTPLGSKLAAVMELVDHLVQNNHRALVFSQFVGHLALVRAQLDQAGIPYQYLDGSTPAEERGRRVKAFQAGEGVLFLITLKAGGTGLNLTGADYVLHLDPWWNPAAEDQATDRAHRIGQHRPVTVYRLVMADSIEERVIALHEDKRKLVEDLLEGIDTPKALEESDLMGLISV